jgi:hypothetical protein
MGFVIAVPSYRRAETFRKRAYASLSPALRRRTYVFVQTPEDYELYTQLFPDVHVIPVMRNKCWKTGYSSTIFFIRKYFPLGKKICFLHDDVAGVNKIDRKGEHCRIHRVDLSDFIPYAFQKMKEYGVKLAGVYPTRLFSTTCGSTPALSKGLRFVYDPLHFEINVRIPECKFPSKCDYEMTAEYYLKHGDVLRFNHYTLRTKHEPLKTTSWKRSSDKLRKETVAFVKKYGSLLSGVKFFPGSGDFSPQFRRL